MTQHWVRRSRSRHSGDVATFGRVSAQTASLPGPTGIRDRNSIPILAVRLGPARDFLIALAVFALVLIVAAVIAFVVYG